MWILLWVILSGFVLGVFGWSYVVLRQQKTAWAAFAKKHNLSYTPGRALESPAVSGRIEGVSLSMFSAIEATADARGQRFVTVIEMDLGPGMPTGAALGTPELVNFLSQLKMDQTYVPEGPDWNPAYIVKARDAAELKKYLTPERTKVLHSIFTMKNSIALFFFDENDCALRVETSDPLRNAEKMERIVKWLLTATKQLKV